MADSALNQVEPAVRRPAATPGDVPERVRRRYLTDGRGGPGLGFYLDASVEHPAFRDHGRRLSADRNDPQVVRDLVAIAEHRGWTVLGVRGETGFRREVWLTARQAGLEVRGYRPTERDLQLLARRAPEPRAAGRGAAERRAAPSGPPPGGLTARARLGVVEAVVRARIVEPAAQERLLAAARARLACWLEHPAGRAR